MRMQLQDIDRSLVLKRYMPVDNFERMLKSGGVYFCRFDGFEDKLEGGITSKNFSSISNVEELLDIACNGIGLGEAHSNALSQLRSAEFPSLFGNQKKDNGDAFLSGVSSWLYASCWTDLGHECQAMWRLYGGNEDRCHHIEKCEKCETAYKTSVCIETTVGEILDNLEGDDNYNIAVQKVKYIDHKSYKFEGNELVFQPFFSKAKHFSYEHEVRFMIWPSRDNIVFSYEYEKSTKNIIPGVTVKVKSFDSMIKKIILSPRPTWVTNKIRKSHMEKHGSALGLQSALSNSALNSRVRTLCETYKITPEIVESDLNQITATDCYTAMEIYQAKL